MPFGLGAAARLGLPPALLPVVLVAAARFLPTMAPLLGRRSGAEQGSRRRAEF